MASSMTAVDFCTDCLLDLEGEILPDLSRLEFFLDEDIVGF
jgi:hypothetical protein